MSPARESTLPQKEKQQFHKLVKCYEQKQFKQGLRYAKEPGLLFHHSENFKIHRTRLLITQVKAKTVTRMDSRF